VLAARNYDAATNSTGDNSNLTTFEEEAMKTGQDNMTRSYEQ
jgi:hypothetical protein